MVNVLEIKKQKDKLIWLAEDNVGFNTDVVVHEGCRAIAINDGLVVDDLHAGSTKINIKRILSKANGKKWTVYGVNTNEIIELFFGCQVKYTEKNYNTVVTIKASGECHIRIDNGSKLYKKLACDMKDGITKDDLCEKFRDKLACVAEESISKIANSSIDFSQIEESKSRISDDIKMNLKKLLRDEYGLEITDIIIKINDFDGLNEIWKLQKDVAVTSLESEVAANRSKAMSAIAEGVKAFGDNSKEQKEQKEVTIKKNLMDK